MAFKPLQTLEDIVNPGGSDRGKAAHASKMAVKQWGDLRDRYDQGGYAPGELGFTYDQTDTTPGKVHAYQEGPKQTAVTEDFLDPGQASAAGLQGDSQYMYAGPSNWEGDQSAFSDLGPSAYEGMSSAYGDLQYDPRALADMDTAGGYFRDLSQTGNDPIAEADYQRRTAEAESNRRANVDAALAAEEAKGMGSGSGRLLAELSGAQGATSDEYQAGLDANALAAQRRDNAALTGANIAQMRGNATTDTAAQRAAGLDKMAGEAAYGKDAYAQNTAQGQDQFTGEQNNAQDAWKQNNMSGLDNWANQRYGEYYGVQQNNANRAQATANRNYDRTWGNLDANTELYNQGQVYNTVDRPQTLFGQDVTMTQGRAGAEAGVGQQYGQNAQGSAMATDYYRKKLLGGDKGEDSPGAFGQFFGK